MRAIVPEMPLFSLLFHSPWPFATRARLVDSQRIVPPEPVGAPERAEPKIVTVDDNGLYENVN